MTHVKPIRSLAKAITWRVFASGMDALVIWKVTGSWKIATGIGIFDVLFKIGVYYAHERLWDHIPFGKIEEEEKRKIEPEPTRISQEYIKREGSFLRIIGFDRIFGGTSTVTPKRAPEKHWLIIGQFLKEPIGCCADQEDVLAEEPGATFQEIDPAQCPICKESGSI